MEKKIQDYLPYYVGCRVLIDDKEYGLLTGGTFVPNSCNQIYYDIQTDEMKKNEHDDFSMPYNDDADDPEARIKPILRKLEDMSEDEMIGLLQSMVPANMEDKPVADDYDLEMFYNDDGLMVDSDIAVGANFTCICFEGQIGIKKCGSIILFEEDKDVTRGQLINTPMAFDYLLKMQFDLFGLIESGLAIDSKTLK